MNLTRYEQETVINFNAEESGATVYTRDRAVMRRLDRLAADFPDVYRVTAHDGVSRTYSMPKSCVNFRKPRTLTDEQREKYRQRMLEINSSGKS